MAKTTKTTTDKLIAFRIQAPLLKKLKYIAFQEETTQTALVENAIIEIIAKYEKKHGEIPVK
jgi:hypothetical protein